MDIVLYPTLAVLGLLVGSFLNVVILRYGTGLSVSKGRSVCFSCGKQLRWYELVPLASFIFLRGKCSECKAGISWQYPLVEAGAALAFVLAYIMAGLAFNGALFMIVAALMCFYIVIFVYDLRHKIIPDLFSYGAAALALAAVGLEWHSSGIAPVSKLIAGPALFAFFFSFWFLSRGTWMGLGDAKLALSVGFFLGLSGGIAAILLSFWIGAAVMLSFMLFERLRGKSGLGLKSEIPFGPFILIGFFIAFIWQADMQSILSFLAL